MHKVLFIDDGIEFDSKLVRQKAFGGAEIAFVSLVEALAKINFKVTVYNNCKHNGLINRVLWKKLNNDINNEDFDTLVVNRGDKYLNFRPECKKRFFWIHNPANYLLKFRYLSKLLLNKFTIIFSSQYHHDTYPNWAPAKKIIIPYGLDELFFKKEKIKRSALKPIAIFTSNPLRKLDWLLNLWENRIFPNVPSAKLYIFSGHSTYGKFGEKHSLKINRILLKAKKLKKKGVILNKPIKRSMLFSKITKSRLFLYGSSIDETFCMSAAESQILCTPGVVMNSGCLGERIINQKTGYVCDNEEEFIQRTIELLVDNKQWIKMHTHLLKNNHHYSWKEIAQKWKKILE